MTSDAPSRHVLVVDDEAIAVMTLERLLTRRGYRISTAGNGKTTLDVQARDPADLVMTDIRMPAAAAGS